MRGVFPVRENRKKIIGNGLLFAAVLGLTLYAVFHGEDLGDVADAIRACDRRWLLPALGCVVAFIWGEAVVIWLLLRSCGQRLSPGRCFLISSVGFFFSAVTPSAGGGQPMQVYFLRREDIPVPVSAVTLMAVTITYKLVLVITGLVLALFRMDWLRDHLGDMTLLFWMGLALTVSFTTLLLILVFHPHLARVLAERLLGLLEKVRILRRNDARRERLLASMEKYHETAGYFRSHMGLMAVIQLITFVQRFALFTVPWLVYRAFGLGSCSWWSMAPLQAAICIAADMLPVPGGMGISEGLFLTAFEPIFGELILPAMVLSRGTDFYCRLLLSAAFTAAAALLLGRRRNRRNIRAEEGGSL